MGLLTKRFKKFEFLFIIAVFIFLSGFFTFGRVGNSFKSFPFLYSDAANIASFAAALDYPEFFNYDPLLANQSTFSFYSTIHVPLIRYLAKIFDGYGTAFAVLIFPTLFIQLIGFYVLGKELFNNTIMSFSLAILTFIPISLNLGEFWGAYGDINPRVLFQCILPYLLIITLKVTENPSRWWIAMGVCGLLVYVHPVSAPVWFCAIIIGWLISSRFHWNNKKPLHLLIAVSTFFFLVLPFVINYLQTTNFGENPVIGYEELMTIMEKRFIKGFLDIPLAINEFVRLIILKNWTQVLLWSITFIAGCIIGIKKYIQGERWVGFSIAGWWLGVLFISYGLPLIDHSIAAKIKRIPLEVDLIRGIRFTIPLLFISFLLLLKEILSWITERKKFVHQSLASGLICGTLIITWIWNLESWSHPIISKEIDCISQAAIICPLDEELIQRIDFLDAIKERTPKGSKILSDNFEDLAIRYYSLRSLSYSYKDGGAFLYADQARLIEWYEQFKVMSEIQKTKEQIAVFIQAYTDFGKKYGADYLVVDQPFSREINYPRELILVYTNDYTSLFKIEGS